MKSLLAAVLSVAFCANLCAEEGKADLSRSAPGGRLAGPAVPAPSGTGGALDTPCYRTEEGCKIVSSFYIARKWRLKNLECSKLPDFFFGQKSPMVLAACERIKRDQAGKGLLDSERNHACYAAHPPQYLFSYATEEEFLRYHGLESYIGKSEQNRPPRPQSAMSCHGQSGCRTFEQPSLPSDPEKRAAEIQRLADLRYYNSVESCKSSWFSPAIEVNSDPTGMRDLRHKEDLLLPICAQGNGNKNGMRYSGSGQDTYNMELAFVCTRKSNGEWTTDSMKLRIDQPTTTTHTTTEGSTQGWNVSATFTIIEKVLGVGVGYSETTTHSTAYGTGTSKPYGSWVPLAAENLVCGSEIDSSGTCSR